MTCDDAEIRYLHQVARPVVRAYLLSRRDALWVDKMLTEPLICMLGWREIQISGK